LQLVVLVVLAVLWAVVLAPPLLRARAEHVSRDSIRDFSFKIGALGRANAPYRVARLGTGRPAPLRALPGTPVPAAAFAFDEAAERSARRRRQVVASLALACAVTFMLAMSGSGGGWVLFGVCVALLGIYGALVAYFRQLSLERLAKVRYLPTIAPPARPAAQFAYRRTVNS
jgi:hypothetical protein